MRECFGGPLRDWQVDFTPYNTMELFPRFGRKVLPPSAYPWGRGASLFRYIETHYTMHFTEDHYVGNNVV
jgi:hypothetical protein